MTFGRGLINRIVFEIAHHGEGGAGVVHGLGDLERLADGGAAINEVAKKDNAPTGGVAIDAVGFGVAELGEEGAQGGGVTVDIAYEVEGGGRCGDGGEWHGWVSFCWHCAP